MEMKEEYQWAMAEYVKPRWLTDEFHFEISEFGKPPRRIS